MLDVISIVIKSWKWWNGCVAARREAGVPFGGPAGWDGGRGWNVILQASKDEQTLTRFRHHPLIEAQSGQNGMIKDRYWANAEHTIAYVPIGTVVKDGQSGRILFQFLEDKEQYVVANGGKGGAGNIHFKNAVNQYPDFALLGEPGQELSIMLELQMLGDVGLIGTPSVGKSSIINTCCATKAKTADYHFTTLEPNIGICERVSPSFSMVDIPGLVAGASSGKWLWNEFLRHILKARIFALIVDMDSYEAGFEKLTIVFDEIISYIRQRFVGSHDFGKEITEVILDLTSRDRHLILSCTVMMDGQEELLFEKAIHILANKYDMINDPEVAQELMRALIAHLHTHFVSVYWRTVSTDILHANSFIVSAATHHGIDEWTSALARLIESDTVEYVHLFDRVQVEEIKHDLITDVTERDLPMLLAEWYIEHSSSRIKVWEIRDPEICRLVNILPRWKDQAEHRFRNVMMKKRYLSDFEKVGMMHGDVMKIMSYYSGHDDKYIMYV